jgi:LmbE family N-acetylglucosaminyl deacetylase
MHVSDAPLGTAISPQAGAAARSFAARYAGATVVAIGAHPDDIELGIGGTLAALHDGGTRVVMAICSVPADYETRTAEARAAAGILGAELRVLMEGGCKRIEDIKTYQLVGLLDDVVRELHPAAVLTHGPTDFHRDHVAVYNACVSTQRLNAFDFYSYLPTMCRPVPVPFLPRAYVDISATIDRKLAAIAAHTSQFYSRGIPFEMYRDFARINGRMVGVEYAEGLDVGRMVFS